MADILNVWDPVAGGWRSIPAIKGDAGVYTGANPPMDGSAKVWVNPLGEAAGRRTLRGRFLNVEGPTGNTALTPDAAALVGDLSLLAGGEPGGFVAPVRGLYSCTLGPLLLSASMTISYGITTSAAFSSAFRLLSINTSTSAVPSVSGRFYIEAPGTVMIPFIWMSGTPNSLGITDTNSMGRFVFALEEEG